MSFQWIKSETQDWKPAEVVPNRQETSKHLAFDTFRNITFRHCCNNRELVCINWWIIQIHYQYVKGNLREFHTISSIHAAGGTWHACSRRIRTISWARLNTTLFLAAHRLFFLQLSLQLIRGGQNQISPPIRLPNFNQSQSTSLRKLLTSHYGGARTSKLFSVVLFSASFIVSNKARGAFLVWKPTHVQDK